MRLPRGRLAFAMLPAFAEALVNTRHVESRACMQLVSLSRFVHEGRQAGRQAVAGR